VYYDTDCFYSWAATDDSGRGTCGVTGQAGRAVRLLRQALDSLSPGAVGTVQVVRLDRFARHPSYIHTGTLLRLRRARPGE
jgi:hypothetical protein